MKSKLIAILLGLAPILICTVAHLVKGDDPSYWNPNTAIWIGAICASVGNTVFNLLDKSKDSEKSKAALYATWGLFIIWGAFFTN